MIYHEGDLRALPAKVIEKYSFTKVRKSMLRRGYGYDPGYTHHLRIHQDQYLLYDQNGFMTWERRERRVLDKKGPRGGDTSAYITIPKPIRTERDLKMLLKAIIK